MSIAERVIQVEALYSKLELEINTFQEQTFTKTKNQDLGNMSIQTIDRVTFFSTLVSGEFTRIKRSQDRNSTEAEPKNERDTYHKYRSKKNINEYNKYVKILGKQDFRH